jgi:hypothetical protein
MEAPDGTSEDFEHRKMLAGFGGRLPGKARARDLAGSPLPGPEQVYEAPGLASRSGSAGALMVLAKGFAAGVRLHRRDALTGVGPGSAWRLACCTPLLSLGLSSGQDRRGADASGGAVWTIAGDPGSRGVTSLN